MSDGADRLLSAAIRFLLSEAARRGKFAPADAEKPEKDSGYIVLGMGKYGARELNYSSDIDLIVFFDPGKAPLPPGQEASPFFVRLTRDLVKLMTERTREGYVFRTDLRLRPDPGATQIALSVDAALHYYETVGQNWERAAYIKARAVAGDIEAGETFLRELSPYIWRKYLDYAAIADIHAMKRQIHAHKGHGRIAVEGHNLKLGRGGIREIEFFVQTQQLIAGGRQPDLRVSRTLDALDRLAARGWIARATAEEMAEAYRFLRRIEHRLQMLDDEQTHSLPSRPDKFEQIARFSGYESGKAFADAVRKRLETVQKHYAALFEDVPALSRSAAPGSLVFTGDSDDPGYRQDARRNGLFQPFLRHQNGEELASWPLSGDAHRPRPREPDRFSAAAPRSPLRARRSPIWRWRPSTAFSPSCRPACSFSRCSATTRRCSNSSPISWAAPRALPGSSAAVRCCSMRCSIPAFSANCPRRTNSAASCAMSSREAPFL